MHSVYEPPALLAGAERQRRVGAVHLARLEQKRTAALLSSTKSLHFSKRAGCAVGLVTLAAVLSLRGAGHLHAPRILALLRRGY